MMRHLRFDALLSELDDAETKIKRAMRAKCRTSRARPKVTGNSTSNDSSLSQALPTRACSRRAGRARSVNRPQHALTALINVVVRTDLLARS